MLEKVRSNMWICFNEKVKNFVNGIYPIVINEYVKHISNGEKTVFPSVCIAQAALESGWNLNATTLFGIKGDGAILDTTEYVNGEYVNVQDSFKLFPDIATAVQGYYKLMSWDNYVDVRNASIYEEACIALTTANYPYATDPDYATKLINIITDFSLDYFDEIAQFTDVKDISYITADVESLAWAVIRGEYGNGDERKERLGELYDIVQGRVNELKKEGAF